MTATVYQLPYFHAPATPSPVTTAATLLSEMGIEPADAEKWGDHVLAAAMAGLSRVTDAGVAAVLEASRPSWTR